MNSKIFKVAKQLHKKSAENNYADIDWLKKLAEQMWNKRAEIESSATNQQDAYRVIRYLQTLLGVTNHLVGSAKSFGMSESAAKKYKDSLRLALHGLANIQGLSSWNEWFASFNNSLDNFHPRAFYPKYAPQVAAPIVITPGEDKKEEVSYPLPPGIGPPKEIPYPLGVQKVPEDPERKSAIIPS